MALLGLAFRSPLQSLSFHSHSSENSAGNHVEDPYHMCRVYKHCLRSATALLWNSTGTCNICCFCILFPFNNIKLHSLSTSYTATVVPGISFFLAFWCAKSSSSWWNHICFLYWAFFTFPKTLIVMTFLVPPRWGCWGHCSLHPLLQVRGLVWASLRARLWGAGSRLAAHGCGDGDWVQL